MHLSQFPIGTHPVFTAHFYFFRSKWKFPPPFFSSKQFTVKTMGEENAENGKRNGIGATKGATKQRGKQVAYMQADLDWLKDAVLPRGSTAAQIASEQASKRWAIRTARRFAQKIKNGNDPSVERKAGCGPKAKDSDSAKRLRSFGSAGWVIMGNARGLARRAQASYPQFRRAVKNGTKKRRENQRIANERETRR